MLRSLVGIGVKGRKDVSFEITGMTFLGATAQENLRVMKYDTSSVLSPCLANHKD